MLSIINNYDNSSVLYFIFAVRYCAKCISRPVYSVGIPKWVPASVNEDPLSLSAFMFVLVEVTLPLLITDNQQVHVAPVDQSKFTYTHTHTHTHTNTSSAQNKSIKI